MSVQGDDVPARVLDGSCRQGTVLGGKGAALDRLIAGAIPVPPTGAVTTAAYRRFVDHPAVAEMIAQVRSDAGTIDASAVDEVFLAADVPADLADEILETARIVGGGRLLAVRSSATVEDLAGSSFAGQYRSLLEVDPADAGAVLRAVRLVFASLWHPAPCAYRAAFGVDDSDVAMAAVFMQMVDARRAGVVFTEDPGGTTGAARIEAVSGLGESLVSGQRTPDAWVVPRNLEGFDGPVEIRQALEWALTVERHDGQAQDVEWAWDGADLWVVQARPITVVAADVSDGFDSDMDDAELTTAGIGEMLPGVLPPLRWQIVSHLVDEAFRRMVSDLGADAMIADARPRRFVRRVRGRAAMDFDALCELARALPGGSPDELDRQYFGSQRPGRAAAPPTPRPRRVAAVTHDLRLLRVERRASLDAEVVISAVARMSPRADLLGLGVEVLRAYLFRLIDLGVRTLAAELEVAAGAASAYRKVELILLPHLGEDAAGQWAERVTSDRGVTVPMSPDASAAVFAGPTWRELDRCPPTEEALHRAGGHDPYAAEDELFAVLRSMGSWGESGLRSAIRTRGLRQIIDASVVALRRREATKAALSWVGGETRRVLLAMGERLVDDGHLGEPGDIELLSRSELDRVIGGIGPAPAPNELLRRGRWIDRYESEAPLPTRFRGSPASAVVELPSGSRLDGWAASPGRFTGVGTVVDDPGDPTFPVGSVLVATATDASWSPLFIRAGAVVVERGGPLSHAAILARELGVPAVLNVAGATLVLSGERVTVDGDLGVVIVHRNDISGSDEAGSDEGGAER